MKRILITGASGRIGIHLMNELPKLGYDVLGTDIRSTSEKSHLNVQTADLSDLSIITNLMKNIDAVIHLGANVSQDGWDDMLHSNFVGTYNVFEACRLMGVQRVVFASSIHAHGFYRRSRKMELADPPRPDSIYGVSKAFGEALGRLYADKYGLEVVCLRIASFLPVPKTPRQMGTWLSPADCTRLFQTALDCEPIHFEVMYGVSRNGRTLYSDPNAERLGYQPQDDGMEFAEEIFNTMKPEDEPELERLFHGAHFVTNGFVGDVSKIE